MKSLLLPNAPYRYFAVTGGSTCKCGNNFLHDPYSRWTCTTPCVGKKTEACGSSQNDLNLFVNKDYVIVSNRSPYSARCARGTTWLESSHNVLKILIEVHTANREAATVLVCNADTYTSASTPVYRGTSSAACPSVYYSVDSSSGGPIRASAHRHTFDTTCCSVHYSAYWKFGSPFTIDSTTTGDPHCTHRSSYTIGLTVDSPTASSTVESAYCIVKFWKSFHSAISNPAQWQCDSTSAVDSATGSATDLNPDCAHRPISYPFGDSINPPAGNSA